jgi:hypothetical protein
MTTTAMTEDDRRRLEDLNRQLTELQRQLRSRLEGHPKWIRRSIDRQRVSIGLPPLWGDLEPRRRQQ